MDDLQRAADADRGEPGEDDHGHSTLVVRDGAQHPEPVDQGEPGAGDVAAARVPGVRGAQHQQRHRQVEGHVGEDPPLGAEPEEQRRADDRAGQDAEAAERRVQAYGAGQLGLLGEVVQQQLFGRSPERAGTAVQDQQHAGLPHLQRAGQEQHAPAHRDEHEQDLGDLDEPAAVVALGQPAEPHRQQQERQPVADHLEADERGGVELLPEHPVGDDVLDVVAHHRQPGGEEVRAGVAVAQGGETPRRSGGSQMRGSLGEAPARGSSDVDPGPAVGRPPRLPRSSAPSYHGPRARPCGLNPCAAPGVKEPADLTSTGSWR